MRDGLSLVCSVSNFSWVQFLTSSRFGYDQGVMGGVIGSKTFVEQFNHPDVGVETSIVLSEPF